MNMEAVHSGPCNKKSIVVAVDGFFIANIYFPGKNKARVSSLVGFPLYAPTMKQIRETVSPKTMRCRPKGDQFRASAKAAAHSAEVKTHRHYFDFR